MPFRRWVLLAVALACLGVGFEPRTPAQAASCAAGNVPFDITTNTPLSGDLYVTGNITVHGGATLTLDPGTHVFVCGSYRLQLGTSTPGDAGGLVAVGTPASPIVFDVGGSATRWGYVYFANNVVAGSRLAYVTLNKGGSGTALGALALSGLSGASPSVDHVTVADSATYGVSVNLVATNTTPPALTNLTITGSALQPIWLSATAVAGLGTGHTFSGNGKNTILVDGGTLTYSQTWHREDLPYELQGNVFVAGPAAPVLTVEPGTAFSMDASVRMEVGTNVPNQSGGLVAVGTAAQPITFAAAGTSKWNYLALQYNLALGSQLSYVTLQNGGATPTLGALALIGLAGSAPAVDHLTVTGSGSYGVSVDVVSTNTTPPALASLTVNGSAKQPLLLDAEAVRGLGTGNSFGNNGASSILVNGGFLSYNQTWHRQPIPYELQGNLFVRGPGVATLTLEPGTAFLMHASVRVDVGTNVPGQSGGLVAVGTATDPITFDAADPSNRWNGLYLSYFLDPASTLQYVTIRGGGTTPAVGALAITGVSGSAPAVDHVTVSGSGFYGVSVDVVPTNTAPPPLTNLTIGGSAQQPLVIDAEAVSGLGAGNVMTNNVPNTILVNGGFLSYSQTWSRQPAPYELQGNLFVYGTGAPVLTLEPGTALLLHPNVRIDVGNNSPGYSGGLVALGTATDPITIDANSPGQSWARIGLLGHVEPSTALSYVNINGGGEVADGALVLTGGSFGLRASHLQVRLSPGAAVYADGGSLVLEDSTLEGNQTGVLLAGAQAVLRRNIIRGNAGGGLVNQSHSTCVDAVSNYWGDASGPADPSGAADACGSGTSNPGSGDAVGDGVLYKPWLAVGGPVQPGQYYTTISPSPFWLVADGVATSTLKITLRDEMGRPVVGKQVVVETTRGTVDQPTAPTDSAGTAIARLRSGQAGVAMVTARNATDGTPLNAITYVTFAEAAPKTFGLINLDGAPYETPQLRVEGKPFEQGRPMVFHLPLQNGNSYPVQVDVSYGISALSIGMSFTPVYSTSKMLQPGESWDALGFWTPDVTGHHCVQVKVQVTPLAADGSRLAQAGGSPGGGGGGFSGQQNTDVKPPRNKPDNCQQQQKNWDKAAKQSLKRTGTPEAEQNAFRQMMNWTLDKWCKAVNALNGDPPTHDFESVATPPTYTLPPVVATGNMTAAQVDALNRMAGAGARLSANLAAAETTSDRLAGAAEAHSATDAARQLAAYNGFMTSAAAALHDEVAALDAFLAATKGAGVPDETITPADVAAAQADLQANGFDATTLAYFHALGYSDADVETLRQQLVQPDPSIGITSQYELVQAIRTMLASASTKLDTRFGPTAQLRRSAAASGTQPIGSDPISVDIAVRNPLSVASPVNLVARPIDLPLDWSVSLSDAAPVLAPGASTTVTLTVYPSGPAVEQSDFRVTVEGYAAGDYVGGVLTTVSVPRYQAAPGMVIYLPFGPRGGLPGS